MSVVTPDQINPGDEITAASVNTPIDQLADVINGGLDDTNISGINGSKIANATVALAKLATDAAPGFKTGSFSPSATGPLDITGVGFKPKFVEFFLLSVASTTVNYGGTGSADGTSQFATSFYNEQGADCSGAIANDKCIQAITTNAVVVVDGSLTSFENDGFKLNITTRTAARTFIYKAYA